MEKEYYLMGEVPTMTTLQRIEQNQGKLLAAINHLADSNIQASLENRLVEQANSFTSLQGRLDAMETILVELLRKKRKKEKKRH